MKQQHYDYKHNDNHDTWGSIGWRRQRCLVNLTNGQSQFDWELPLSISYNQSYNNQLWTRLLDRRGHSRSQHTRFLKMRMIFFCETLIHSIGPTRSHFARFARARFALRAHENFRKKSVSQSTQNALKRIEMQNKKHSENADTSTSVAFDL